MKPIGLAMKDMETNPFTERTSGEPMVVHLCLNCGKISYNRLAGDDNPFAITRLLKETENPDTALDTKLRNLKIKLLAEKDKPIVLTAIYGYDYQKYLK